MHERRLQIEETKAEINRQGLVDSINKLSHSVLALAVNKNQHHHGKPLPTSSPFALRLLYEPEPSYVSGGGHFRFVRGKERREIENREKVGYGGERKGKKCQC